MLHHFAENSKIWYNQKAKPKKQGKLSMLSLKNTETKRNMMQSDFSISCWLVWQSWIDDVSETN